MAGSTRYHVVNKIAHGGMAEIFLALQLGAENFQKAVVLKRILPALAADPSFVRMLVDEAHIASRLNHSNLVQVLDLGMAGNQYFLVLEFVDGWSLAQILRRAQQAKLKLPVPLALYIVGALCRGLAYVHTRRTSKGKPLNIIHRDVTPQNVLLSREGEVKLADFGIAKAVGKTEKSATGVIKGKFAYMSPEQSLGAQLDARSDLFSVGTLLYLLTTGRKPFDGTTDLDVIQQVRRARYAKPSSSVKDFNPDVERFIARALRVNLARRWQSAEQMADKLDSILIKLGQPSGPAPLKRWMETLSARDGVKPPADLTSASDPSIAVELGSLDLELVEVAPETREEDDLAGSEIEPSRTHQDTVHSAPTRLDAERAAQLARSTRAVAPRARAPVGGSTPDPAAPTLPLGARFRRWVRRTTIKLVVTVVLLGTAAYFVRPYAPVWLVEHVNAWVRRLPPPLGDGDAPR
ncbi:MAG: eukaryotic-like serine/threonine-protein kinase [Myxococcales bacterium]|jgi:serine/threonine-protein kinase|nr:eukaryotic-like serine/threonine-protein kinase [Myxococcales bacterium]